MSNIQRSIPFLVAILHFLVFEIFFGYPKLLWLMAVYFVCVVFLFIFLKVKNTFRSFLFLDLLLFILSCMGGILFVESSSLRHLFVLSQAIIVFVYLSEKFSKPNFLVLEQEIVSSIGEFFSIFTFLFFSVAIFGFQLFINIKYFWISLVLLIFSFLLANIFFKEKEQKNKTLLYKLSLAFIVWQVFLVLSFLPFNFYIKSLLLTSFFYGLCVLMKKRILSELFFKKNLIPVIITVVIWVVSFLTVRWI